MPWDVSFVASFFMGSCRMDIQQGRESGGNSILMTLSLNKIIRLRIKSVDILLHYSILWSAFPTPEKISLSIIILPIGIFLFTNTYLGQRFP